MVDPHCRSWWGDRGEKNGARRRWPWILVALVALIVVVVGSLVTAYPTVAAAACPGCYGMTRLRLGLYVEDGLPAGQRLTVSQAVDKANQKVSAFYGGRSTSPRILVCMTAHCYHRIGGGGERGVAVLNRALIMSPLGANPVIASHETVARRVPPAAPVGR